MPSTTILSDDLSGAAELAGLAYSHGLTAEVQREIDLSTAASVIAVDTDSRQRTAEAAAHRLGELGNRLRGLENVLLYKKTDSLLRGNVRAEIEAIMQAAGYRRTIFIAANPSRGRTVSAGRYFIEGQPLDQTSLANDPHHPRRSSNVLDLLGDGTQPVHVARSYAGLPATGIIVPDATSIEVLATLANQVDDQTLAAGAADFFQALLKIRAHPSHPSNPCPTASPIKPPALLVCGSRLAWPTRRSAAKAANLPVIEADDALGVLTPAPACVLGFGDREVPPEAALATLSSLAARFVNDLNVQTLLVEGGETAAALAGRLNWTRFKVAATAPSGVGVLRPLSNPAPLVLIKPGSYAWPATIWDEVVALRF